MRIEIPRSRGISLVAVLVAATLGALVLTFIMRTVKLGVEGSSYVAVRSERESIRWMLLGRISCKKTFETNPCTTAGQLVDVKTKAPAVLISHTGTLFGQYTLRAECNSSLDGIIVRAARLAAGGSVTSTSENDFLADPLTKRKMTWSDPGSLLFGQNIELCPSLDSTEKQYCGITAASYNGSQVGGWAGALAKCETRCGSGADICATRDIENTVRAGLTTSIPASGPKYWYGGMDHGFLGQNCSDWTSTSSGGNTLNVDHAPPKIHTETHSCGTARPIVCCK